MPDRATLANAIRALSMDAVQQANSGHPGMPMGMATIAEVLWNDFLQHNPSDPAWFDRDRFILSNGHGSMLHYALLHLSGYAVSIDDLKQFRQLGSNTPGHPEFGHTPGVETTTGPLGQGIANAVGMALAEKMAARTFNTSTHAIVDHYTYCFVGDGCLMEGISHEACSLAGTHGLGKLIVFYDDNGISIDGDVSAWFSDDTPARFRAYQWHVIEAVDGHDAEAISAAIKQAQAETDKPTLICCKTVIGFGSPNLAGSEKTHGAPLGQDEISATRKHLNWSHPAFVIPDDVMAAWDAREKGQALQGEWQKRFQAYQQAEPELAAEFSRRMAGKLPSTWRDTISAYVDACQSNGQSIASRKASLQTLNAITPSLPELLGGSADLTGSNLTKAQDTEQYLYYGVREFGMAAIMNGIALHGGFIPFGGTFLVFSDYMRNAVRLSAMIKQRVVYVFTHDSIGLGEDGPTHQPIEHAASLRLIPDLSVWRPCDSVETAVAWRYALEQANKPTALLLSRQTLAHQAREPEQLEAIQRGGYILRDCAAEPELILLATGSEVSLATAAWETLSAQGRAVRVVSMPSTDVFDAQDANYREQVLPSTVSKRIAIEAAAADYWYKYVGLTGKIIALTDFGGSAPAADLMQHFGLTTEHVITAANELL